MHEYGHSRCSTMLVPQPIQFLSYTRVLDTCVTSISMTYRALLVTMKA